MKNLNNLKTAKRRSKLDRQLEHHVAAGRTDPGELASLTGLTRTQVYQYLVYRGITPTRKHTAPRRHRSNSASTPMINYVFRELGVDAPLEQQHALFLELYGLDLSMTTIKNYRAAYRKLGPDPRGRPKLVSDEEGWNQVLEAARKHSPLKAEHVRNILFDVAGVEVSIATAYNYLRRIKRELQRTGHA